MQKHNLITFFCFTRAISRENKLKKKIVKPIAQLAFRKLTCRRLIAILFCHDSFFRSELIVIHLIRPFLEEKSTFFKSSFSKVKAAIKQRLSLSM